MKDNPIKLELIQKLEKILNLAYVSETASEGRVCFAESEELRSEFKTIFTAQNLQDYLFALKNLENRFEADLSERNNEGFRFPKNAEVFWKMVEDGNKSGNKK
jgi:hypothetical protein